MLPARLLFATNPRTIPETNQNTSLFLTHPQQRPRTPPNEFLEGHFETNPSRVWSRTWNRTYFSDRVVFKLSLRGSAAKEHT